MLIKNLLLLEICLNAVLTQNSRPNQGNTSTNYAISLTREQSSSTVDNVEYVEYIEEDELSVFLERFLKTFLRALRQTSPLETNEFPDEDIAMSNLLTNLEQLINLILQAMRQIHSSRSEEHEYINETSHLLFTNLELYLERVLHLLTGDENPAQPSGSEHQFDELFPDLEQYLITIIRTMTSENDEALQTLRRISFSQPESDSSNNAVAHGTEETHSPDSSTYDYGMPNNAIPMN